MWNHVKNNWENQEKGLGRKLLTWPAVAPGQMCCNEWWQPKAWGQISVSLSWCGLRLKKHNNCLGMMKSISDRNKAQRNLTNVEMNYQSSASQGHQENFGSQKCSLPILADKNSMIWWLCFFGCHIQVWWLQLTSIWSRYELPQRPQLLHNPVAPLLVGVSHEA